jgi:hypothetical protein
MPLQLSIFDREKLCIYVFTDLLHMCVLSGDDCHAGTKFSAQNRALNVFFYTIKSTKEVVSTWTSPPTAILSRGLRGRRKINLSDRLNSGKCHVPCNEKSFLSESDFSFAATTSFFIPSH